MSLCLFNDSHPYAPHTLVYCQNSEFDNLSDYREGQLEFPLVGGKSRLIDTPTLELLNHSNSSIPYVASWLSLDTIADNTPSIGAAFSIPSQNSTSTSINVTACAIYAGWSPTEMYIGPYLDTYIHSSPLPQDIESWNGSIATLFPTNVHMKIDPIWANPTLPPASAILTSADNSYKRLPVHYVDFEPFWWMKAVELSLALLFTDALAILGRTSMRVEKPGDTRAEGFTEIKFDGQGNQPPFKFIPSKVGYGYTLNSNTKILSCVVLLTHTLIALIHTILVIWFGWSWTDANFSSICDVLLAAFKSPPMGELEISREKLKEEMYTYTLKVRDESNIELSVLCNEDGIQKDGSVLLDCVMRAHNRV